MKFKNRIIIYDVKYGRAYEHIRESNWDDDKSNKFLKVFRFREYMKHALHYELYTLKELDEIEKITKRAKDCTLAQTQTRDFIADGRSQLDKFENIDQGSLSSFGSRSITSTSNFDSISQ